MTERRAQPIVLPEGSSEDAVAAIRSGEREAVAAEDETLAALQRRAVRELSERIEPVEE